MISGIIQHAAVNKRESHKLMADAEKLAKKYKLPEKRLWYLKVKAFGESGQWPQLRSLADSRAKPPIGFKPFARAAIKHDQATSEITRYIDRVQGAEERYDLYCEAKAWKKALDEATKLKDAGRVGNVRAICNSPETQQACDQILARLTS